MPFEQVLPRSLTDKSVRANAPDACGVYGLSNAREWVYVGRADSIQGALLGHLREGNSEVMRRRPTGFCFELCDPAAQRTRQDRLVFEYEPICNRMAPKRDLSRAGEQSAERAGRAGNL